MKEKIRTASAPQVRQKQLTLEEFIQTDVEMPERKHSMTAEYDILVTMMTAEKKASNVFTIAFGKFFRDKKFSSMFFLVKLTAKGKIPVVFFDNDWLLSNKATKKINRVIRSTRMAPVTDQGMVLKIKEIYEVKDQPHDEGVKFRFQLRPYDLGDLQDPRNVFIMELAEEPEYFSRPLKS